MAVRIARKLLLHLALCAVICLALARFSVGGALYAGFAAAFLGAAYLLAAWLRLLKGGGTDLLGRLKRKAPPKTPYFHSPHAVRRHESDSLEDEQTERQGELPPELALRLDALVFALCGAVMLAVSLLI